MAETAAELGSADLRNALVFAGDLAGCRSAAELDDQVRRLPRLVGAETIIIARFRRPAAGN